MITRAIINTSPEPVTNWTASVTEDLAVVGGLWTALNYPWLFLVLLLLFLLAAAWLLPKIWRALKGLFRRLAGWMSRSSTADPPSTRSEVKSLSEPEEKGGRGG